MSAEDEPMEWQPMETCPRSADGCLNKDVWIGPSNGRRPYKLMVASASWVWRQEDKRYGRLGWLPGNLPEADLPPAPEVSP